MSEIIIIVALAAAAVAALITFITVHFLCSIKIEKLKRESLGYIGTILDSSDGLYRKGFGSVIAGLDKMRTAYLKNGGEEIMAKKMIRNHIALVIGNHIAFLGDLLVEFDINQQNQPKISEELREQFTIAMDLPDTEKKLHSLFEKEFEEIKDSQNPASFNEFKKKLKMPCFQRTDLWAKFYARVAELEMVS